MLSLVLSFASKESTTPLGAAAPPPAPESARQSPPGQEYAPAGTPKGFPRGKQSARFALPCAPLVVCLNSGSLTAFGGCIHWIPASLRSPLETFGHRSWRETHRTASPNPHCSRRIMPPVGNFLRQSCCSPTQAGGFPLAPCTPSDRSRRNFDGMNRELSSGANHRRGPYPPPSNPIALRKEPPSCRQPSMKS